MSHIVKIQAWWRGCNCRNKRLPNAIYSIQKTLKLANIEITNNNNDGRINSVFDECEITNVLKSVYGKRIFIPKIRAWYDVMIHDYMYGWLPINIKSTKTTTSDNTGNLAMCVYAYTNNYLPKKEQQNNGKMCQILCTKLKSKKYNKKRKKDYYFVVLNKNDTTDIIVNSLKGLSVLTPNINNLPFQIRWDRNREFEYKLIDQVIEQFIECVQRPAPSWKEKFITTIRSL